MRRYEASLCLKCARGKIKKRQRRKKAWKGREGTVVERERQGWDGSEEREEGAGVKR